MNIFAKLRKLKSADDYDSVLPELEAQHRSALEHRAALEQSREDAIFSGTDLTKLKAEVTEADEQISNLSAAIEGATRRRNEAAERAKQERIERRMAEARSTFTEQRRLLALYDVQASELAGTLSALKAAGDAVDAANKFAGDNGRGDLRIKPLMTLINELATERYHAHWTNQGIKIEGNHAPIANPTRDTNLRIPSYWPNPPPSKYIPGTPYALVNELPE